MTAIAPGFTRIVAQIDTVHGSQDFVVLAPVAQISLPAPTRAIVPLAAFYIDPDLRSTSGEQLFTAGRHLEWSSSAPGTATVARADAQGKVVAVGPGTAVIQLKATDEQVVGSASVSVITLTYRFDSLTVGGDHACALTSLGAAYCWGENDAGALGNGTAVASWSPVPVSGGLVFASLYAGNGRTCGLTAAGSAYCWGDNSRGEFGNGTTTSSTIPVPAVTGHQLTSISLSPGSAQGTGADCGMTTGGQAYCWGPNEFGQVGNGSRAPTPVAPSAVQSPVPLVTVTAGGEHACGLSASGAAYCWGNGHDGELGRPTFMDSLPGQVEGGPSAYTKLVPGLYRTCGVTSAGEVWCWGLDWARAPVKVQNLPEPIVGVHVTVRTICGTSSSQVIYCWNGPGGVPQKELGQ